MKPTTFFLYYGASALSAPEVAAFAKHDVVVLAGAATFAANADAIRAVNPNCKVLIYINWNDAQNNNSSVPIPALQQISRDKFLLRQSPASSAAAPMLAAYMPPDGITRAFSINTVKIGALSGMRYGPWYVANAIGLIPGIGSQDGFFIDVAALGPTSTNASVVNASASGSVTAAAGASTITDSTKSGVWTGTTQRFKLVRMTSGAAAGEINWVESHTTTALTMLFPFSAAPGIGDTYESYTYGAALSQVGQISADYNEDGGVVNNDSLGWRAKIAAAYSETLNALNAAYPNSILIPNGAGAYNDASLRGVDRTNIGTFYEGAIGSTYEVTFTGAVSQLGANARRFPGGYCTASGWLNTPTDYTSGRYILAAALMCDSMTHLRATSTYTSTVTLWLDEFNVDLGEPASDTERHADGTWHREYTQAYIVANPTAGTIVVQVPAGFRRIRASDYANQDPTLNDGSTNAVSLLTKTAVMFVRV